jgi:riboflavin kinase/FMN adenylyltransferase
MKERKPRVWVVGTFDGVHRGHQALLERAREVAAALDEAYGVVTFDPPPVAVLRGPEHVAELTPAEEKLWWLAQRDVPAVEVLAFTPEFAQVTAEEFEEHVLARQLQARALIEGYNFTYGQGGRGTAATLAAWGRRRGVAVEAVPPVAHGGEPISSSRIRQAVRAGDLPLAAALLGRPYSLRATVVRGDGRGRDIGFPTANLVPPPTKVMPPYGVYAGRVRLEDGESTSRLAVASWGVRPMFALATPLMEVHVPDFDENLYGRPLLFEFHFYLRPEQRFADIGQLRRAIAEDIAAARRLLGDRH